MPALVDRTNEFTDIIENLKKQKSAPPAISRQSQKSTSPSVNGTGAVSNFQQSYSKFEQEILLQQQNRRLGAASSSSSSSATPRTKSQFYVKASAIAQELNTTSDKLYNLTRLIRKKDTFNEYTGDIQELTYIIKERLASHNTQLDELAQWMNSGNDPAVNNNKQSKQNSSNVINMMKSRLMNTTKEFKEVLQSRTKNLKAVEDRRSKLSFGTPNFKRESVLYNNMRRPDEDDINNNSRGGMPHHHHTLDMNAVALQEQQQLQQFQRQHDATDDYINSRTEAVREIESTIVELSGMFSQLAQMVAEQEEQVKRIGDDIDNASLNVEHGQNELLKYLDNISSNRGLILKVFFTIVIFLIVFTVFVLR